MAWLGIAVLLVAPVGLLALWGASWKWFALGVVSWGLAVALKIPSAAVLYRLDESPRFSPLTTSAIHGLISAVTELGLAAIFLRGRQLPWQDVLAFGVGIGAFEIAWILFAAVLEMQEQGVLNGPNLLAMGNAGFLLERALTLVGHVASRVLVYAAVSQGLLLSALVAVVLFTLVDGAAVYGGLAGWDWEKPGVHARFLVFLAVVGAIEAGAAWHFGRPALLKEGATDPKPLAERG